MSNPIRFALEYLLALYRNRNMPRARLVKLQEKLWQKKLPSLNKFPAFAQNDFANLRDFKTIDIAEFRANSFGYNLYGYDYESAYKIGLDSENGKQSPTEGINIGLSSGTSAKDRGIFITNEHERTKYIANILAKAFSPFELLKIRKIALCLRANNPLYEKVNNGRIKLKYFALDTDRGKIVENIAHYSPDIIVAPTQIILKLAHLGKALPNLKHLFYGAESMNQFEADYIKERLGLVARPIYQATEGFLGIGCKYGTLHINEDNIIIEREYIDENRFVPIITDLSRQSQAIVRLRLDDIWQETKCTCGSKFLAIKPIEGRVGDIWHIDGKKIFPNDIIDEIGPKIEPWRNWQIMASPKKLEYSAETDEIAEIIEKYLSGYNMEIQRTPYNACINFPKMRHIGQSN